MAEISVTEQSEGLRINSPAWEIVHLAAAGGAWSSIVLKNGSGRNLLRAPATSALRFVRADPQGEAAAFSTFAERNEKSPYLRVETEAGVPVVVAEGTYRDEQGKALPVGYRRRTSYHDHGLIWTTLEIMSEAGCDGVVEARALELPLHAGFTDCHVRLHPTQGGGADLLGAQGRFDLGRPSCATDMPSHREGLSVPPAAGTDESAPNGPPPTPSHKGRGGRAAFVSRYTPLQILCSCREQGGDGIELFPASELAQWDCAFKADLGLGLYSVSRNEAGVDVLLSPYCMAFRRMGLRLQGHITLRLGVALQMSPAGTKSQIPKSQIPNSQFPKSQSPNSQSPNRKLASVPAGILRGLPHAEEEIARLARAGVGLLRFRDCYREGAPFWRNGAYPPYDEAGMSELQSMIKAAHRHGLKIVPCVSLKELHPETTAFREYAPHWMRMAAQSLDMVHNWMGTGESGAWMCMKSGWMDYCKQYVDAILSGLPWDGLELDLAASHACCHPKHAPGPFHSDVDNVLDFLSYCRARVGKEGVLALSQGCNDSIVARNLAGFLDW